MAWEATIARADVDSPIAEDEAVVFFPTFAHLDPDGASWHLPIHGWIHEPEEDSALRAATLGLLRRALGLTKEEAATSIFKERARPFLADNERGKRISIRLGETDYVLGESEANGHFHATLRLPAAEVQRLLERQERNDDRLRFQAVTREGDGRVFAGAVELIGESGLSVISDIDDTIKVTGVASTRSLLENTFLRELEAVPGMAPLYRAWKEKGAKFHYVSSSPWQLFAPLSEFSRKAGFPGGSFHLKLFRWKDSSFFDLFASPAKTKPKVLEPILATFPRRKFILVGDSGEEDPEVYGALARKHPEQVERILIRATAGEMPESERFQRAFQGIPRERWQVFARPEEVKDLKE
jgi:phosphatidate phosphatase APP1